MFYGLVKVTNEDSPLLGNSGDTILNYSPLINFVPDSVQPTLFTTRPAFEFFCEDITTCDSLCWHGLPPPLNPIPGFSLSDHRLFSLFLGLDFNMDVCSEHLGNPAQHAEGVALIRR